MTFCSATVDNVDFRRRFFVPQARQLQSASLVTHSDVFVPRIADAVVVPIAFFFPRMSRMVRMSHFGLRVKPAPGDKCGSRLLSGNMNSPCVSRAVESKWDKLPACQVDQPAFRVDRHFLPDQSRRNCKKRGTTVVSPVIFDGSVPSDYDPYTIF